MEFRQLKYFIQLAEVLNFSEASQGLYITQSTLSQQIKQLETELNVMLFSRSKHEVVLTEAGKELLPLAYQIIHQAQSCYDKVQDLQQLKVGTLNIGVTYTFSPILTEAVIAFMKLYPQIKLNIYYKSMEELMKMLGKREVDFVLSFKPSIKYEQIESHILFDNRLAIIVNSNHYLAKQEKITLPELEKYDMILPTKGLQARNVFDRIVDDKDYHFKVKVELNEVNILLQLIKKTNLVTILSQSSILDDPEVKSIPIDAPGNEMEGCFHLLKGDYVKNSTKKFIDILCETNSIRTRIQSWFL